MSHFATRNDQIPRPILVHGTVGLNLTRVFLWLHEMMVACRCHAGTSGTSSCGTITALGNDTVDVVGDDLRHECTGQPVVKAVTNALLKKQTIDTSTDSGLANGMADDAVIATSMWDKVIRMLLEVSSKFMTKSIFMCAIITGG